jgi:small subunit ribosomal protein S6
LTQIYEGMFLLDNQVVRTDWKKAKAIIADTLTKHGGTVHTLRRWEEKRLAYPIQRNNRATYYLAHYELPAENIAPALREFDLSENVLRYLLLAVAEVPEEERKLAALEEDSDYVVPEPPADDATDDDPDEEGEGEEGEGADGEKAEEADGEKAEEADGEKAEEAESEAAPKAEEADGEKAEEAKSEAAPKADEAVAATTEGADAPKES